MVSPHSRLKRKRWKGKDFVKKLHIFLIEKKMCLTTDQATQIYEEEEKNELINI